MDLNESDALSAFRQEVRAWLRANVPAEPLPSLDTAAGFAAHRRWEALMAAAGLAVVTWPEQYGGRGADLIEWLVFEEEYWRSGAPARVSQNGIFLLAPTVFEWGTEAQKDRFLTTDGQLRRKCGRRAGPSPAPAVTSPRCVLKRRQG